MAVANGVAYDDGVANTLSVLMGDGLGSFGPATGMALSYSAIFLSLADLNGDGHLDLAATCTSYDLPGAVTVIIGNGHGGFFTAEESALSGPPASIAMGDLDGDGNLDLAAANGFDSVLVVLGDGQGGFGAETKFPVGSHPWSIVMGDFNNDGKLDVIAGNFFSDDVSVLLGDGQGGVGGATNFFAGSSPFFLATCDLNGDGNLDLAVANFYSPYNASLMLGNGQGAFGAPTQVFADIGGRSIVTGDWNGDGKLDMAVAYSGWNTFDPDRGRTGGIWCTAEPAPGFRPQMGRDGRSER
jgi:hypothetical protein